MNLNKKRWLVLIASCLINLCIGSLYAWSVFATPMAGRLSEIAGITLTSASLAIVFTVANSVGPITMISGGRINDKFGPKFVILLGGILFGGGMLISGFATSVGMLVISYGVFMGLGMGLVYGCTINNSVKFFPDKRGLIGGITTATYGLSSVIIPPIANVLIGTKGIANTFKILGTAFLVIICCGSFFVEKCPANYAPAGWNPPQSEDGSNPEVNKNWREMLSSPVFYNMIVMLICGAFFGLMCISQASSIAQKMVGLSTIAATTVVSVLALFNAAGRVVAGHVSDKIGRINTLMIAFIIAIIGLILLFTTKQGDVIKFYIGIAAVGLCFGSFMGVFPGFTADQFGARNNSVNYGIMFIGFALAGIFGPMLIGKIYLHTQSYHYAFLIAICLALVGLVLTFLYRKIIKKK